MAKKQIPETTDAESELADLRVLRGEIEEARKVVEEKKLDLKEAREAFEALVDSLLARLGDENRPLLTMAEESEDE